MFLLVDHMWCLLCANNRWLYGFMVFIPKPHVLCFIFRNVAWREVFGTVFLATMVCVIAALLLSVVDFYQGFWAFWLCFVVGTAHFSLVKVGD